jgi:hypothetical protein
VWRLAALRSARRGRTACHAQTSRTSSPGHRRQSLVAKACHSARTRWRGRSTGCPCRGCGSLSRLADREIPSTGCFRSRREDSGQDVRRGTAARCGCAARARGVATVETHDDEPSPLPQHTVIPLVGPVTERHWVGMAALRPAGRPHARQLPAYERFGPTPGREGEASLLAPG